MGYPPEIRRYTLEEYLELEELAEYKSEYHNGEIFAMSGGSPEHSSIAANCVYVMKNAFKNTGCRVFESNLRVQVEVLDNVMYPDASVVCGPLERNRNSPSLVRNTSLILEVLSKSTASYDRGSKFHLYQMIPSLQTYVLVAQSQPRVYVHYKNEDGAWDVDHYFSLDDTVQLKPHAVGLSMREIYELIEF